MDEHPQETYHARTTSTCYRCIRSTSPSPTMKCLHSPAPSILQRLGYLGTALYLQYLTVSEALAAAGFGADIPAIPGTATGGANQTRNSIVTVINFILTFLALVAVIFVIIGGVRILAAGGNEEQVTKGRKTIIFAIIGLVIVFFARVIVGFFTAELAGNFTN